MYWEKTIDFHNIIGEAPTIITPSDLTDANWTNGISNKECMILVKANDPSFYSLIGKEIKSVDENIYKIIDVKRPDDTWTYIVTDKPIFIKEGYPNTFEVID